MRSYIRIAVSERTAAANSPASMPMGKAAALVVAPKACSRPSGATPPPTSCTT